MAIEVLVATPHAPLGKLIRQVLEQNGAYATGIYGSAADALAGCQNKLYAIAILDWELSDRPVTSLGLELKQLQPGLKLIIFPPENNPNSPLLAGFTPDAYLNKPFYLPDLMGTMTRLLAGETIHIQPPVPITNPTDQPSEIQEQPPDAPAAGEPSQVGPEQIVEPLCEFLSRSGALASVVFKAGAIWAYAGDLPEGSIQHLKKVVTVQWGPQAQGDLLRFIHFDPGNSSQLFFATRLSDDLVLSVLYPSSTPFSWVRMQAIRLGHSLAEAIRNSERDDGPATGAPSAASGARSAGAAGGKPALPPAPVEPAPSSTQTAAPGNPAQGFPRTAGPTTAAGEDDEDNPDDEAPVESLPPLFKDVPIPKPVRIDCMRNGWVREVHPADLPEASAAPLRPAVKRTQAEDALTSAAFTPSPPARPNADVLDGVEVSPLQANPVSKGQPNGRLAGGKTGVDVDPRRKVSMKGAGWIAASPADPLAAPEPFAPEQSLETVPDNRPLVVRVPKPQALLEPTNAGIASLTYTCVLVPRLPQHFLTGEIGASLGKWLPQLCLAFGWNLEGLAVRPSHMEWVIRLPPMVAPGKMLRIIRQRVSQRIFTAFPQLEEDNPSGDFWSPGYLIVSGTRSLPTELLQEYVSQTRQRQ